MRKRRTTSGLGQLLAGVRGKRARIVAEHIANHGSVTTNQLRDLYGYGHPPRAKQDLQEQGIPIETFFLKNKQGRRIAGYHFGDISSVRDGRFEGRRALPMALKEVLLDRQARRCAICMAGLPGRYLQIDHRVPYGIAGEHDTSALNPGLLMLLCTSCNRAKSWSCEHCPNWLGRKDPRVCRSCYWSSPESYKHAATVDIRRLDVTWAGDEVPAYERLAEAARRIGHPLPDFVKDALARFFPNP